jgi:hypothetical protein
VLAALEAARRPGLASTVVLVAHRCTDATAAVARQVLGAHGHVITDDSDHVAGARRAGATHAFTQLLRRRPDLNPRATWLLSTDADTVVPPDWVARLLGHAYPAAHAAGPADGVRGHRRVAAVAGLADLDGWEHGEPAWHAYQHLVQAGIEGSQHRHAYAANLAVQAEAYLDVGGWPDLAHGEEHALLAALVRAAHPVRRPTDVTVRTSARRLARAVGGLGDLIEQLAREDAVPDPPAPAADAAVG